MLGFELPTGYLRQAAVDRRRPRWDRPRFQLFHPMIQTTSLTREKTKAVTVLDTVDPEPLWMSDLLPRLTISLSFCDWSAAINHWDWNTAVVKPGFAWTDCWDTILNAQRCRYFSSKDPVSCLVCVVWWCVCAEGPVIIFMEPHCVVSRQARIRARILEDVPQYLKDRQRQAYWCWSLWKPQSLYKL